MPSRLRSRSAPFLAAGVCVARLGWSAETTPPEATPNQPSAAPQQHFEVSEYRVIGNTVLPSVDIERVLYPLLGLDKTLTDVESAKGALEKLYHDRGFSNTFVDIPPQDVTDGIVRLRVAEARIERSQISGGHYFSERDVIIRVPAVQPGTVMNFPELQQQLTAINTETPDRSVVPVLKAGSEPGTVDIALKVKDDLPLHGSLELNNQQTVDTRPLRAAFALSYGNLFGRLDSISLQYQMTPQQPDQVRVFAANYTMHAWSSGLQPSFSYINSNSNVATVGAIGVLGKGQIGSFRLTYPLVAETQSLQSLSLGVDYKHFRNTVTQNGGTALDTPISYVNLSLAYSAFWRTDPQITTFSLSADAGPRGIANNPVAFANDRYKGRSNYFYLRSDLATTFKLPEQFSLRLRAAGQAALEPIISNENYSIGGSDGVRGYLESEELGDSGIKGTVQLQSPTWHRQDWQIGDAYLFYDAGRTQVIDPLPGERGHTTLRSWGGGIDLLPGQKVSGSLTVARTLIPGSTTKAGDTRVLFLVHGGF